MEQMIKIDEFVPEGWCVYVISNLMNQRKYVGITSNFKRRMQGHETAARCGRGNVLHASMRKHGISSFVASVVVFLSSRQEALEEERRVIFDLCSNKNGYNLTSGGDGIRDLSEASMKQLKESLSKALKGKPKSKEHVESMRKANLGKVFSQESREAMSRAAIGRKASPETKLLMSISRKGRRWSEEQSEKMSIAMKGRTFTDETIKKMTLAARRRGGKASPKRVLLERLGIGFATILDASMWLRENGHPKASPSGIRAACLGVNPRAYGEHWAFINTTAPHRDSLEDAIAYSALLAESALKETSHV